MFVAQAPGEYHLLATESRSGGRALELRPEGSVSADDELTRIPLRCGTNGCKGDINSHARHMPAQREENRNILRPAEAPARFGPAFCPRIFASHPVRDHCRSASETVL